MTSCQLPLQIPHRAAMREADYLVGQSNRAVYEHIVAWPKWPSHLAVLCGPRGCGKSHIGAIWRERSGAFAISAPDLAHLSVREAAQHGALLLENAHLGCDAPKLFHLMNEALQGDFFILIIGRGDMHQWPIDLPDARSRLRAGTALKLDFPEDELLKRLLVKLFADRQIDISAALLNFLIMRMERSFSCALDIVDQLDRAGLAKKKRQISRPMVARILQDWQCAN